MKLMRMITRKRYINSISFAIPFLGILMIMIFGGYSPFGDCSMLYSDMYHQYFPFFKEFRSSILSGDSLLYNWNIGMGLDFLGLFSYYLASPLNLLSILVPEKWLLGYFSLLVPIKLGLASLFFGIFLQKIFKKQDLSIPFFSAFYGLCAWALGYQWNVMWLDTFALLPLVMVGMVSLLKKNKFILYTLTLFLSIYTNYYIGLFTCFFVFLTFFCYEICRFQNIRCFFIDLGKIALFSLLAIGMTAFVSLPTLAALQNTQSSVNIFPKNFVLNIADEHNIRGLFKAMMQVAGNTSGGIQHTFKEGLPNLYCGVITTILSFQYFLCKQIRLRDKFCAIFLLIFFNISFIIRQLDYIWHGFHFTNMIPYRFSFLYSFVMLYMAYSAWCYRKHFKLWQILVSAAATIGITCCYHDLTDITFWVYNAAFILLYISILIYFTLSRPPVPKDEENIAQFLQKRASIRMVCHFLLIGTILIELVLNVVNFGTTFPCTNISNYPKGTQSTETVVDHMKELEQDNLFYRAEVTHSQTLNDGALNGYSGISTFTSSANVHVTRFMQALGYAAKDTYNRYCYEEASPVANLFLSLKYMIERDGKVEDNPYFDDIYSVGDVHLLKNNAYLPLGFLSYSQILNADFSANENPFAFQNRLMEYATGLNRDVWHMLPSSMLTIAGDSPTLTPQPSTGYCAYTTEEDESTITYTYTANAKGLFCVYMEQSQDNYFKFWVNNKYLYGDSYSLPQMLSVSYVEPGDVIDVVLDCESNQSGTIKITAAILNEATFREGYDRLAASPLNLTEFNNTRLVGTMHCDHDGVLYTSIPQNGNWHAYVDGIKVDTVMIGDAMLGLLLAEGEHTIELVYRNDSFRLGLLVSIASIMVLANLYLIVYKPKFTRYKGKYVKK